MTDTFKKQQHTFLYIITYNRSRILSSLRSLISLLEIGLCEKQQKNQSKRTSLFHFGIKKPRRRDIKASGPFRPQTLFCLNPSDLKLCFASTQFTCLSLSCGDWRMLSSSFLHSVIRVHVLVEMIVYT